VAASDALISGICTALQADAAVAAIVKTRVYRRRPRKPVYPFVAAVSVMSFPERQDNFDRDVLTVQLDAWACRRPVRLSVKPLVDAVGRALDQANFELDAPYALARIDLISAEIVDDAVAGDNYGSLRFECEVTR
jgi:hypothetical protein